MTAFGAHFAESDFTPPRYALFGRSLDFRDGFLHEWELVCRWIIASHSLGHFDDTITEHFHTGCAFRLTSTAQQRTVSVVLIAGGNCEGFHLEYFVIFKKRNRIPTEIVFGILRRTGLCETSFTRRVTDDMKRNRITATDESLPESDSKRKCAHDDRDNEQYPCFLIHID